jgi:hypothetical protein
MYKLPPSPALQRSHCNDVCGARFEVNVCLALFQVKVGGLGRFQSVLNRCKLEEYEGRSRAP